MQASMQIFSSVFHLYLFVSISLMSQISDHTEIIGTLTEIKGGGNGGLWITLTTRVPFMIKNMKFHVINRMLKRKCRRLDGKTVSVLRS